MTIKILFLGEIVARPGRKVVGSLLPNLKKTDNIDLVIANIENIAHGRGATRATAEEILGYGVDYCTSGDHIFHRKEFREEIEDLPVLRPANWPQDTPGKGSAVLDLGRKGKVLLINILGRTVPRGGANYPFRTVDRILKTEAQDISASLVDIHAEATSEKAALAWYLDGRVSAVVGTHTHVPTADPRVLPQGTAFVTDVGMCGARDSVLGCKSDIIIDYLKNPWPRRFEWVEKGAIMLQSVVLEIEEGEAKSIKRIDKTLERG